MTTQPPKKQPIPFGKYLLLDRINIGGMAEVWRGKTFGAGGFERIVAIKRILPNIAEDEEFITMFIDEAKITVQLTHANIAQIYELGKISTSYFIAMEYIPGKDLRTIFDRCRKKGEPAPVPLTCYVISKVCEGLDYAHRKKDGMGRDMNIVHRDVSPQNVLISYEGEVKVIDFGIAKAAGKATKTQAGILKGKFGYMSPEQIRGLPLDRRSDIFAVGVCLYEMLTGERLFVGDSDFSVLEKVRKAEVLPPSTYNRRVPPELEKIVLKALAKDVDDRYQYANELADDLQRFLITSDSIFSRKDLMQYMKSTFAEEVEREKLRLQEYAEVKPPEGMLAAVEMGFGAPGAIPPASGPAPLEGAVTHTPTAPPAGPPVLTPAGVPVITPAAPPPKAGPPVLSPSAPANGPAKRGSSLTNMPKLTAAAPMLSNAAEEDGGATVLVDRSAVFTDDASDPTTGTVPEPQSDTKAALATTIGPVPKEEPSGTISSPTLPTAAEERRPSRPIRTEPAQPAMPAMLFAGRGKLIGVGLGAGALVAAIVVAALLLFREPPSGLVLIELPSGVGKNVKVNINGELKPPPDGEPPTLLTKVPVGKAVVMIVADGFETFTQQIDIREGSDVSHLKVKLKPLVKDMQVEIRPEPPTAGIWVDGKLIKPEGQVGKATATVSLHDEHFIEVKAAGYQPYRKQLVLKEAGPPLAVTAKLEPYEYEVMVSSDPTEATVVVGKTEMGETPATVKLKASDAQLVLKKRCYESKVVRVSFPPEPAGEPITVSSSLKRLSNCR